MYNYYSKRDPQSMARARKASVIHFSPLVDAACCFNLAQQIKHLRTFIETTFCAMVELFKQSSRDGQR